MTQLLHQTTNSAIVTKFIVNNYSCILVSNFLFTKNKIEIHVSRDSDITKSAKKTPKTSVLSNMKYL